MDLYYTIGKARIIIIYKFHNQGTSGKTHSIIFLAAGVAGWDS